MESDPGPEIGNGEHGISLRGGARDRSKTRGTTKRVDNLTLDNYRVCSL